MKLTLRNPSLNFQIRTDLIPTELIQTDVKLLHQRFIDFMFIFGKSFDSSEKNVLFYPFIKRETKVTVVISEAFHSFELYTKL